MELFVSELACLKFSGEGQRVEQKSWRNPYMRESQTSIP